MKKIILIFIAILVIPVFCFAQNKKALNHFWDIPWGISIEQAEKIFGERDFTAFRDGNSLITQARYEGEDAVIILLFNRVNRFFCGNVVYTSSEITAIPKYENYRKVLFRRYGMPDTAVEYFVSPFEKGDGKEIEAISSDNALYLTEWLFNDSCLASLSILRNLDVCMSFQNPAFSDVRR